MEKTRARLAALFAGVVLSLPIGTCGATECLSPAPFEPIHHVCGMVIDPSGEPIPNAKVAVLKDHHEIAAVQTAKDGNFSFGQLEAGKYDIQVHRDGYLDAYFSVVITKPALKCNRVLQVNLDVGLGCSIASLVKARKAK
jgi:carboxypeptidase family protein